MELYKSSFYSKILAFSRFLILKIWYFNRLQLNKISFIGSGIRFFIYGKGRVIIRGKIHLFNNVEIQAKGKIEIGDRCTINSFSRMVSLDSITLGNRVVIAQFVSILDHNHPTNLTNDKLVFDIYETAPIVIGNNVWIADKVTITKGVNIGDNVIIAANSVVTRDIPSNTVYGGIPAKELKKLV